MDVPNAYREREPTASGSEHGLLWYAARGRITPYQLTTRIGMGICMYVYRAFGCLLVPSSIWDMRESCTSCSTGVYTLVWNTP